MLIYLNKRQRKQRNIKHLVESFVTTTYARLIQKKKKELTSFLENQSQHFNNERKLNTNRRLKQKSQHKKKEKIKFFSKEHIKEMQCVSSIATTKLNSIRTMFYHIN